MNGLYTLKKHVAVPCDMAAWGEIMRDGEARRVARTVVGSATVSTVFIGMDHSFGKGPPMLFETMVFGGALDDTCQRCTTWEQAEAMHADMCKRVQEAGAK